jgi:hypothetical protein
MMKCQVLEDTTDQGGGKHLLPFEQHGPEFRLHVRKYGVSPRIYFVGQFPFIVDDDGNRHDYMSGSFCGWDGKPDIDTER